MRVVIYPMPRIEGRLRIEVVLENGKVKDAWSYGSGRPGSPSTLCGPVLFRGNVPSKRVDPYGG
jgi:hypothetical protein